VLKECLDVRRPKKQQQGENCIMKILIVGILNVDLVAVGSVVDVSEKLSASIFELSGR
jgi:hypothetical protein